MFWCEWCDGPLDVGGRGPAPRFCSAACRQRARRAAALPREMAGRGRWVRHSRKRPVTADGLPASVSDPGTWCSYREAKASGFGDGFGFVLGDGVGGLDLDGVVDADGSLAEAARTLLDALPATYTEVSPSGRGLHVFGLMPERPGRVVGFAGIKVEIYSKGRFFTVTGRRWGGAPSSLADLGAQAALLTAM